MPQTSCLKLQADVLNCGGCACAHSILETPNTCRTPYVPALPAWAHLSLASCRWRQQDFWEPLIWSLSAPAFPDSGPDFSNLSTCGSPWSRGTLCCSALTFIIHPLSLTVQIMTASEGTAYVGRKAFSILFLISLLKLPSIQFIFSPGWMLQEFAGRSSEALHGPPKTWRLLPTCVLVLQLVISHLLRAWNCVTHKSVALSTSSCSCCYSLGQATVLCHWETIAVANFVSPMFLPFSTRVNVLNEIWSHSSFAKLSMASHCSGVKSKCLNMAHRSDWCEPCSQHQHPCSSHAEHSAHPCHAVMLWSLNLNTCFSLCLQYPPDHLSFGGERG